ncbi:MAG TPA: hypothetical protein VHL08_02760 [Dongiaceae bacterium]|jgi:hypothetical protein|nr:hypothetical protein [Dongiaceae bacterium]
MGRLISFTFANQRGRMGGYAILASLTSFFLLCCSCSSQDRYFSQIEQDFFARMVDIHDPENLQDSHPVKFNGWYQPLHILISSEDALTATMITEKVLKPTGMAFRAITGQPFDIQVSEDKDAAKASNANVLIIVGLDRYDAFTEGKYLIKKIFFQDSEDWHPDYTTLVNELPSKKSDCLSYYISQGETDKNKRGLIIVPFVVKLPIDDPLYCVSHRLKEVLGMNRPNASRVPIQRRYTFDKEDENWMRLFYALPRQEGMTVGEIHRYVTEHGQSFK